MASTKDNCGTYELSLCFDCEKATDPTACPWVARFSPIPGWVATPTKTGSRLWPVDSFHIEYCPLFKRDACAGGMFWDDDAKAREFPEGSVAALALQIINRAVLDWKLLKFGKRVYYYTSGETIYRYDLLEFFFSDYFEELLKFVSERSPAQVRESLGITDNMKHM